MGFHEDDRFTNTEGVLIIFLQREKKREVDMRRDCMKKILQKTNNEWSRRAELHFLVWPWREARVSVEHVRSAEAERMWWLQSVYLDWDWETEESELEFRARHTQMNERRLRRVLANPKGPIILLIKVTRWPHTQRFRLWSLSLILSSKVFFFAEV